MYEWTAARRGNSRRTHIGVALGMVSSAVHGARAGYWNCLHAVPCCGAIDQCFFMAGSAPRVQKCLAKLC